MAISLFWCLFSTAELNCVGQAPVNDKDDPYMTDNGQLVFAVPRAPVDGGPCLVSYEWILDYLLTGVAADSQMTYQMTVQRLLKGSIRKCQKHFSMNWLRKDLSEQFSLTFWTRFWWLLKDFSLTSHWLCSCIFNEFATISRWLIDDFSIAPQRLLLSTTFQWVVKYRLIW